MFSEYDIVDYCRQCKGGCTSLHRCPLRMEQAPAQKPGIVPLMPVQFPFNDNRFSTPADCAGGYSTGRLIAGLYRLNSHF